jgi:hypothetical protein
VRKKVDFILMVVLRVYRKKNECAIKGKRVYVGEGKAEELWVGEKGESLAKATTGEGLLYTTIDGPGWLAPSALGRTPECVRIMVVVARDCVSRMI